MRKVLSEAGYWLLVFTACQQGQEPRVLAQIDEVVFNERDLTLFEAKMPEYLASPYQGEKRVRDMLQSMIDREILVLESTSRGYVEKPEFQEQFNQIQSRWLIDDLMEQEAGAWLRVSEEEARAFYNERDLGRTVLLAQIVLETEKQAHEVISSLEAGGRFAEIAREESIAENATLGGELRRYMGYGDISKILRDTLWKLEEREFTRNPVKLEEGWGIFKVLDIKYRPFEEMSASIVKKLGKYKWAVERQRLINAWGERLALKFHRRGIDALLAWGDEDDGIAEEGQTFELATYGGESLSVATAAKVLVRKGKLRPGLTDSLHVVQALLNSVLGDRILVRAARNLGLAQDEEFLQQKESKRRELLSKELWRHEIRYKVNVSEEEVRQVYQDSIHKYTSTNDGGIPKPFQRVEPAIRLNIKKRKENELFEIFMERLRERYADRVTWFDQNIKAAASSGLSN